MPKIPGINHLRAVRALEKGGFRIVRQGKHIVMSDGSHFITIPRHNPVNALTMGGIVKDAGMSVEEFRNLLSGKLLESLKNDARLGVLQPGFLPATNDKCARTLVPRLQPALVCPTLVRKFYVNGSAESAIETRSLPIAHSLCPRSFTLITRTASCSRQLPSCVAVYPRD